MSSDYQESYDCEYCGYKHAEYWSNNYSNSWHCPICDSNEYEAGDDLYNELNSEKEIKSWLVSELGRRYTPTGNKLIKAKALAQVANDIFELSTDNDLAYEYIDSILDYLRFKYNLIKSYDVDDNFLKNCRLIIINLLNQED